MEPVDSLPLNLAVARAGSRPLANLAACLLAGGLIGQSPLVAAYSGVGVGVAGSQIFFDLTVVPTAGITIKSLDLNLSSLAGTIGTISVLPQVPARTYTAPLAMVTPAWWFPASTGSVTAQGVGRPSHVCIAPPLFLPSGVHGLVVQFHRGRAAVHREPAHPTGAMANRLPGRSDLVSRRLRAGPLVATSPGTQHVRRRDPL